MSHGHRMAGSFDSALTGGRSVTFHLLGEIDFDHFLALQRRLVYELGADLEQQITVLLCEHPALITVGRRGSRAHIKWSGDQLRRRGLAVRWVSRGGGCVLHGPGQLAIYPLVPLTPRGWSVGQYQARFQHGIQQALQSLAIAARPGTDDAGLWGRSGQLAAMGIAVRNEIAHHGCFVNVNPAMAAYHFVGTATSFDGFGSRRQMMGCLAAERSQGVKMAEVRSAIIEHLAGALDAEQHYVYSGHPLLPGTRTPFGRTDKRAS